MRVWRLEQRRRVRARVLALHAAWLVWGCCVCMAVRQPGGQPGRCRLAVCVLRCACLPATLAAGLARPLHTRAHARLRLRPVLAAAAACMRCAQQLYLCAASAPVSVGVPPPAALHVLCVPHVRIVPRTRALYCARAHLCVFVLLNAAVAASSAARVVALRLTRVRGCAGKSPCSSSVCVRLCCAYCDPDMRRQCLCVWVGCRFICAPIGADRCCCCEAARHVSHVRS